MTHSPELSATDRAQIANHGLTLEQFESQIARFRTRFPKLVLDRPATVRDGIVAIDSDDETNLLDLYRKAVSDGRVTKFVPASGAASRMFQSLLAVYNEHSTIRSEDVERWRGMDPPESDVAQYLREIERFPFYESLAGAIRSGGGATDRTAGGTDRTAAGTVDLRNWLHFALTAAGLDLARTPKGLIPFHRDEEGVRTAFEEHLHEGHAYARSDEGDVRIHFTVSPEHRERVESHLNEAVASDRLSGSRFELGYSEQHSSTDTVAVDGNGAPLRDDTDSIVFRPGGHGALLQNLGELAGDIVFVKNIDNLAMGRQQDASMRYKRLLAGVLLQAQGECFRYLDRIESALGNRNDDNLCAELVSELSAFIESRLGRTLPPSAKTGSASDRLAVLRDLLDRPIRACGMVANEGEPGGGPYWVEQSDGTESCQIVEKAQIDLSDPTQAAALENATHFNPVDLVCGLRDRHGRPFDLSRFVDPETGLISEKSKDGQVLKALELPGLWNGSMAHWNTIFVEVPLFTFNPVKTVLDLLRPAHQGGAEI